MGLILLWRLGLTLIIIIFFNILFAIVIVIQSKDITEGNVLKVYVCKTVIHAAVANEAC